VSCGPPPATPTWWGSSGSRRARGRRTPACRTGHAAGDRFDQLELNVLVQRAAVTDDPLAAIGDMIQGIEMPPDELLDTPFLMLGDRAWLRAHVDRLADLGIGSVTVFADSADAIATLR
jgi:hypothetical protein